MSLPGSFQAKKKDGTIYYRSSITYKNKHISLGSFPTETEAHAAYLQASAVIADTRLTIDSYGSDAKLILNSCLNDEILTTDSYSIETNPAINFSGNDIILSFEKWVILANFRDNNIYFSTPIYVRPKFFYYYLTREMRLTFDIDDLFFYASHKISRRGGHLFVADYGMQLSIHARYGIKNYAVLGKDYRFINEDIYDYRYENIEILNPYHGVSLSDTKETKKYCAKIHLHGNYTIGYYESAMEAAIAYNKAIDIVKRNGCKKNFMINEMEGISPSVYADIYSKLKVSEKIMDYLPE